MSSHHDPVILINFKIFQFQPAWWFFWQVSFLVSSFHFTIFLVLKNCVNYFSPNGQFCMYLAIFQRKFTKFSTTILNEVPDDIILAIFRCDFVDIECWSRWNERFNIYFKLSIFWNSKISINFFEANSALQNVLQCISVIDWNIKWDKGENG